jgi:hypothetical protein
MGHPGLGLHFPRLRGETWGTRGWGPWAPWGEFSSNILKLLVEGCFSEGTGIDSATVTIFY